VEDGHYRKGLKLTGAKRALGIIALPPVGRSLAILLAYRCSLIIDGIARLGLA
jgi:hypothetical protein